MLGIRFSGRTFGQTPIVAGSRNTLAIDGEGRVSQGLSRSCACLTDC